MGWDSDPGQAVDFVTGAAMYPQVGLPERCYMFVAEQNGIWTYDDAELYCESITRNAAVEQYQDNDWGYIVDGPLSIGTRLAIPQNDTQNNWVYDFMVSYAEGYSWVGYPGQSPVYENWAPDYPGVDQDWTIMLGGSVNAGRWATEDDDYTTIRDAVCEYVWPSTQRPTGALDAWCAE